MTNPTIASLSDADLLAVITAADRLDRPIDRRFEGDDTALVTLMVTLDLKQTLVDKLLVVGAVQREALHRGLTLPHTRN